MEEQPPRVEPFATDPRIIIIENGDVDAKSLLDTDVDPATGRETVWSEADAGILVVLNGGCIQTGQHKTIYGIVYVVNGFVLGVDSLQRPLTLSVKLVPNTWRELRPPAAL